MKRTSVYRIVVSAQAGYQILPHKVGRSQKRRLQAYECMNDTCGLNFRLDCRGAKGHGCMVWCPRCRSDYVEWLTFDEAPEDVFLDTQEEMEQIPLGRATNSQPAAQAARPVG